MSSLFEMVWNGVGGRDSAGHCTHTQLKCKLEKVSQRRHQQDKHRHTHTKSKPFILRTHDKKLRKNRQLAVAELEYGE